MLVYLLTWDSHINLTFIWMLLHWVDSDSCQIKPITVKRSKSKEKKTSKTKSFVCSTIKLFDIGIFSWFWPLITINMANLAFSLSMVWNVVEVDWINHFYFSLSLFLTTRNLPTIIFFLSRSNWSDDKLG